MRRRRLGHSDLEISAIGFGAWAAGGGGWWGGYGPQDDSRSIAAIHRAIELGVNWIDTAPVYGLGHSEEVVGRAVAGMRDRPYIFTKCGLPWDDEHNVIVDVRPEAIRRELEESLRRLGVDVIDLYQIHWPPADPADKGDIRTAWETLVALRDEGKVRSIGVSNFDVAQLEELEAIETPASLQPPYSLLVRDVEDGVLPHCREHGIGVIVYSPLASGFLAGSMSRARVESFPKDDWRRADAGFQEPKLTRNLAVADGLTNLAARLERTPGELAVAWVLANPAVSGAIVGLRDPSHVDAIVGASEIDIAGDLAATLETLAR